MSKKPVQRKSEHIQPALPGTHDLHLVVASMKQECACSCAGCPPWTHNEFDCRNECTERHLPHHVIRGYTHHRNAAASCLEGGRSFGENEPE